MNAIYIISTYVLIDDTLKAIGFKDHHHASVSSAEILTVAVIAAKYFQNHHERALCVLQLTRYLPQLSVSRFNRRLHQAWELFEDILAFWAEQRLDENGKQHYVVDTMPLPACHKTRAEHCAKLPQLQGYLGRVAAKREWFCGWRLHWLCDTEGFPIAFDLVPAVWHELTTIQYLMADLPEGSQVYGDGAYLSHDETILALLSGIQMIPERHSRLNQQNTSGQKRCLRRYRNAIETAHSLLQRMGVQRLHAVTQAGFGLKVYASLFVLAINLLID